MVLGGEWKQGEVVDFHTLLPVFCPFGKCEKSFGKAQLVKELLSFDF